VAGGSRRGGAPGGPGWLLLLAGAAACGQDAGPGAGVAPSASAPPAGPPPSVLWISVDTLRADRLSCYGNPRPTSPNIDRLARGGALFERAWSTTSWTLPAHVSMLTGLPISAHGLCFSDYPGESPQRGTFVSEVLAAAGYATAGFYAHNYLERPFFLDKRWEVWERIGRVYRQSKAIRARWEAAQRAGDKQAARRLKEEHHAMFENGAPEADDAVDHALTWLRAQRAETPERPFLLFLHVFDVHTPYKPPAPFDARFDPDYTGTLSEVDVDDPNRPVHAGMDPRDLEHVLALYDGEIGWVDSQIGRLLDELDALDLTETTLVVLTADHGDEFLEHGGSGHHHTLFEELLHVPLILRWPGRVPAGARVAERVSLVDIAPTVYAACGLPAPEPLPGVDLLALARGGPGAPPVAGRVILSELRKYKDRPTDWQASMVLGDEQFIVTLPGTDHATLERVDLSAGLGAPAVPLDWDSEPGRRAAEELERQRALLLDLRARAPKRDGALEHLSELDRSELSALGYAEFDLGDEDAGQGAAERLCLDGCQWPDR